VRDAIADLVVKVCVRVGARAEHARLKSSLWFLWVSVVYVVASGARALEQPEAALWSTTPAKIGLLLGSTVVGAGYVVFFRDYRRLNSNAEGEIAIYKACERLAQYVLENSTIGPGGLGVHVWEVSGRWPFRHLARRRAYWPEDSRLAVAPIIWRKGKGVIGTAWKADQETFADLDGWAAITRDTFEALPRGDRYGMRWSEVWHTRRFRAIAAFPLHGGPSAAPRVIGCVSVDVTEPGKGDELKIVCTTGTAVQSILALCEDVFADG
jgi:hypothetical protein